MSLLVTAWLSVRVTTLPLITTPVTASALPLTSIVKAPPPGAVPASASSKESVSVAASTVAVESDGATVSVVLLTMATGPKLAATFSVGTARSRIRSPAAAGWVYWSFTVWLLFGAVGTLSAIVVPEHEIPVGVGWTIPLYVTWNALGGVVAVQSSASLMSNESSVPAALVEPVTNVGAVTSGIWATLALP